MWHVDVPTRDELEPFAELIEPGLVTILLPTTPVTAQAQADRIQLKNLGAEAVSRLTELGGRSASEVAEIAEEIADLVEDDTFWAHQSHGLAVIVVADHVWALHLPMPVGPSVHVGGRVPLLPLLAAAASQPRECPVLALAEGGVRLIDVAVDLPPAVVRVPGLPASAADGASEASTGDRSHSGRLVGSEGKGTHVRADARAVDAAVRPVIAGSGLPLVLAAAEPIRSIYTYPDLLTEASETNPDRSSDDDLAAAARDVLAREHTAQVAEHAELVESRRSQSRVASDRAELAQAAVRGAIDTLFLADRHRVAGSLDAGTEALTLDTDADAIDDLCRLVPGAAGTVVVLEADALPEAGPVVHHAMAESRWARPRPRPSRHVRALLRNNGARRVSRAATVLVLAVVAGAAGISSGPAAAADSPTPTATESVVEPDLSGTPAPEPTAPTGEASADATATASATSAPPAPTTAPTAGSAPAPSQPSAPPVTAPPVTAPARQDSPVSRESVVIALLVLTASVFLLLRASRRRPTPEPVTSATAPDAPAASPSRADTTRFLVALGEAMIDAGDPVTDVRTTLERVAHRTGIPDAEVVVFATALIVSLPDTGQVSTAVASAGARGLRLDQIDEVFDVVDDALTTDLRPSAGVSRLQSIRGTPPPWGIAARVTGYIVMSVGLSLILGASLAEIAVAAVLGAVVGALQLTGDGPTSTYRTALPLVCAFGVSTTVFLLARTSWDIGVFAPLIAPLVSFLPGALLTTGVLELATGQMISGAGRLAAGTMRLVLLAVGIVAAAQLVGVPTRSVTDVASQPLGPWAPWIGVAVFGVGIVLHLCARPRATPWILLVLYVAYAGQVIGGLFLGGVLSAFTGAVLMTPVAIVVARHRSGPTTLVSFLPAFWLLVPGALGLVGVAKYIGDERIYGAASLITAGETMVAIALGVLIGSSLGSALTTERQSTGRGS